jgi:hypothetical protein
VAKQAKPIKRSAYHRSKPAPAKASHPKVAANPNDPAAIVECSICFESVIGVNRTYLEIVDEHADEDTVRTRLHPHQPQGSGKYGIF